MKLLQPLLVLILTLAAPLTLSATVPATVPTTLPVDGDAASIIKELRKLTDSADVDDINTLANLKTEEARDGLLELYPEMQSMFMRRAILQGLTLYDGVTGLEEAALQGIMDSATTSPELEMRLIAVDLLARCQNWGKRYLKLIVTSDADDEAREYAFQLHTARPRSEDLEWYKKLYDPSPSDKKKAKKKKKKKKKGEVDKVRRAPRRLREIAFEALVTDLDDEKVLKAAGDRNHKIRLRALEELNSRSHKQTDSIAEKIFERGNERISLRLLAAGILIDLDPKGAVAPLVKAMTKIQIGEHELGVGIARLLADLDDEDVNKTLLKGVGKGKGLSKVMSFHAARKLEDPKVDKALLKGLKDKDERVVQAAIRVLAERKFEPALVNFEKLLKKDKEGLLAPLIMDAMAEIRRGDAEWEAKLVEFATSEDSSIRNNALYELGQTKNPDYMPALMAGLENPLWSTRLSAAKGLQRMRLVEGVGAIANRVVKEDGRMLVELSEILFSLTGKPFGSKGRVWENWWKNEGADFEIPSEKELKKRERDVEERRLRQISKSTFFGLRIVSKRVIFIIDVSGSMEQPTLGEYVGETGDPRMEVAKREMARCLDGIERESLFNIITFSGGVTPWEDTVSELNTETLEAAKGFVNRLGAGGGTNLYGAISLAFEDPDVDTIFVLSDGEPTMGDVTDPYTIREDVAAWNENRGVKVNCIAIGGNLQVLEWLAEDHDGSYVKIP